MAELPRTSPSVQIAGGAGIRTAGAPTKGQGFQALGQAITKVGRDLQAANDRIAVQGQKSRARQAASDRLLQINTRFSELQQRAEDPETLFTDSQQLLQDFIAVSANDQKALGPAGTETFRTVLGGQLPSMMSQVFGFHRQFAVKRTQDDTSIAIDQAVRDISLTPLGRGERLEQLHTFLEDLDPSIFPDKAARQQQAFDRVAFGIAVDEAHARPDEVLRKLAQPGGFAVNVGRGQVIALTPEQQEKLREDAFTAQTRQLAATKRQQARDDQQLNESRILANNQITTMILNGEDWEATASAMLGGPGQLGPPVLTSQAVRAHTQFARGVDEQRARGGIGDAKAETEWMQAVTVGDIHDPSSVLNHPTMNWPQKQNVLGKLNESNAKALEQGGPEFLRAKKAGIKTIEQALGGRQSIFSAVDPEGDELLAITVLEYDALMEGEYQRVRTEVGTRGQALQQALRGIDPRARAIRFIEERLQNKEVFRRRLRTRTDAMVELLGPYTNEQTFQAQVQRDLDSGRLTKTKAALLHLYKSQLSNRGLTLSQAASGQQGKAGDDGQQSSGQFLEERSLFGGLIESITKSLMGLNEKEQP